MLEVAAGCHNKGQEAEDFGGSASRAAGKSEWMNNEGRNRHCSSQIASNSILVYQAA